MQIIKYVLGELETNCYLLIKDEECVIIDPSDNADFLLEEIQRRNLKLTAMLATHGHFDHIMAAGEIQLSFDIPLYIHLKDQFLIDRLAETAKHFLSFPPSIIKPKNIQFYSDGLLKIKNFKFKIIFSPGHTPGSICLYLQKENILFTGDTLFKDGVGRTDFSYSSRADLEKSLKTIFKLPPQTVIYPGHGEESSLRNERVNFSFLKAEKNT
jgi:glyoxylase-like metal-dependent hydrolase (beta-lactamase superfamily II)